MNSRDDILGRVRRALGRNEANRAVALDAIRQALATPTLGPGQRMGEDLLRRFCDQSLVMSSTIDAVAALADAPAAVARYLAARGLGSAAVIWPALAGLDWAGSGLTVEARRAVGADRVGITGCFCAVAETGSLMLCSGAETPSTVSLLPETHVALVPASRLVATMEDAWALWRAERGALPRSVNFVSGPSRTGDIEQTIVVGAHGPARVHLVVVNNA